MKLFRDMLKLLNIPLIILVLPYILIHLSLFWEYIPFEVTFESMSPTYKKDEVVFYTQVASTDIKVNDLILYDDTEYENTRLFHRVVELVDEGYVTKGDGNLDKDNYIVKYADVVGKVYDTHIPLLGLYVKFINDNSIILYASVASWILFFFLNVFVIIGDKRKDKRERLAAAQTAQQVAPTPAVEPKKEEVKEEVKNAS